MIDFLDKLDRDLLIFLNGPHGSFWDNLMIFFTEKFVWVPFYAILLILLAFKTKKKIWIVIVLIALLITTADQFASAFLKPFVGRLRPCHDTSINYLLYLAKGCGGTYGFISSHAANTFAIACFISLIIKNTYLTLLLYFWAITVSYSRIYLGVHYPGDILGGALAGVIFGYIYFRLFQFLCERVYKENTIEPS